MTGNRSESPCPTLSDGVLQLGPFTLDDVKAHLAGEDDEHARRFGWYPQRSTADTVQAAIERWQDQWAQSGPVRAFAARSQPGGGLVGGVELRLGDERVAQISYWVFPHFRRRGHAARMIQLACRHAFDDLDVDRIEAIIEPDNLGSLAAAGTAGFQHEGRLRRRGLFGDERRDMLLLALLPTDLG